MSFRTDLQALINVTGHPSKRSGDGGYMMKCPAHDDKTASLSVTCGADGRTLLQCFAGCTFDQIRAATPGFKQDRPEPTPHTNGSAETVYPYHDADGTLLCEVVRQANKKFLQRKPIPGGYEWKTKDVPRTLYRLPEFVHTHDMVLVLEGEKDVDRARSLGFVATTWRGGAGSVARITAAELMALRGRDVVLIPDNDDPGREAMRGLAAKIGKCRWLELPELPDKGDLSDWADAGGTEDQLRELTNNACEFDSKAVAAIEPEVSNPRDTLTDEGNVRRIVRLFGVDFKHSKAFGWLAWDGKHWKENEKHVTDTISKQLGNTIRAEIIERDLKDPDTITAFARWAKHSSNTAAVMACMRTLKADPKINADFIEFDAHPYLLNCPNGTLDLLTGALRPHERGDFLTKMCPTEYDPDATCPAWLAHLNRVFDGDRELIEYFAWLCGYILTGNTSHDLFIMAYGTAGTGKSTSIDTFGRMLGKQYSMKLASVELLQTHNELHSTGLASICGARMVKVSEFPPNARLNEERLKNLTGGGEIQARFIGKDNFEFTPSCKLIISTNEQPSFSDTSKAILHRIRVLPFVHVIRGTAEDDPYIEPKLDKEAPGIMAWAVRALLKHGEKEPQKPAKVVAANLEYVADNDIFGQFETTCTEKHPNAATSLTALYKAFSEFAKGDGIRRHKFNKIWAARGYKQIHRNTGTFWTGIRLTDDLFSRGENHPEKLHSNPENDDEYPTDYETGKLPF